MQNYERVIALHIFRIFEKTFNENNVEYDFDLQL